MSPPAQLLEVQDLDSASDRLKIRRRDLPQRGTLADSQAKASTIDQGHSQLVERRAALTLDEHELGDQVAEVAARAKQVEDTLYSGTVTAAKDLTALQAEIRQIRDRQSNLEEREMELLEAIDQAEDEMSKNRQLRKLLDAETAEIESALGEAEVEIDAELAELTRQKLGKATEIPAAILAEYERLRGREQLKGRVAAPFSKKNCGGCGIQLPVLEFKRLISEPEDAVLTCVHCGRLLVR